MKHTLILPDGTVVSSGEAGSAIGSIRVTASVNPDTEPMPGGVCAAELEAVLFDEGLSIAAGDVLVLRDENGLVGTFLAETPTRPAPGRLQVLAYDYVTRLDASADGFLESVTFPVALGDFAQALCGWFGLTLTGELRNADYAIPAFQARGVTGRQLMQWVCQAGCRFCRAAPDGTLVLEWFTDSGLTLGPTGPDFYYQGSLTLADYVTAPIDGVRIGQTEQDVGVTSAGAGDNCLHILGNYLLTGDVQTVADDLHSALADLTCTPCTLTTATALTPGRSFTLISDGRAHRVLAMTVERSQGRFTVTCTGSPSRTAASAVCRGDYRALSGRVLNVQLELEGVKSQLAQFGEETAQLSQLTQDVDHITARVAILETGEEALGQSLEDLSQRADQQFSQLSLRSDGLEVSVGALQSSLEDKAEAAELRELAEHFRFDADGLTISNSASGMGIGLSEQRILFTGGADPTTCITPNELQTTGLRVASRLDVGSYAWLPRTNGNLSLRWTESGD